MELDLDKLCLNCMEFTIADGICTSCGFKRGFAKRRLRGLRPGAILHGRYLVGRMLGEGGFGITYIGLDLEQGRKVAIKEFMPANVAARSLSGIQVISKDRENFEYGLNRFYEEAKTIYKYRRHPNIIHIYKLFQENGTAYYVMEYLEGQDMQAYINQKGGKMEFLPLLQIVLPVMDALERVHQDHIIHRDISPDNIFVGSTVKLLDFGAARLAYGNQNRSLSVILKKGYAPAEQYYRHGRQGPWTDIYALSATMYKALTGVNIPEAPERLKDDRIQDIRTVQPEIPSYSADAIMKGLSVKAEARYSDIREFRCAFMGEKSPGGNKTNFDPVLRLYGVKGFYAGMSLTETEGLILGRSASECQLVFPKNAAGISRLHCGLFIDKEKQAMILQDMNSTYGTFLNGRKLEKGEAAEMKNGDRLSIGNGQVFEIEF